MFNNWEKKWSAFSVEYAKKSGEKSKQDWSKHFSQICVFTSNIVLSLVVTHINEFKLKTKDFDNKFFKKHLNDLRYKDVESIIRYIIMDFMILLIERKEIRDFLTTHKIDDETFEFELFECLGFSKDEIVIYYKMKPLSGTLEHSVHLIEMLGANSEAKNEGLLLGIEYFKKNFFDNLKKHLFKLFEKK